MSKFDIRTGFFKSENSEKSIFGAPLIVVSGASLEGVQGERSPQECFRFSIVNNPKKQPLIYFDYYQKIFAP